MSLRLIFKGTILHVYVMLQFQSGSNAYAKSNVAETSTAIPQRLAEANDLYSPKTPPRTSTGTGGPSLPSSLAAMIYGNGTGTGTGSSSSVTFREDRNTHHYVPFPSTTPATAIHNNINNTNNTGTPTTNSNNNNGTTTNTAHDVSVCPTAGEDDLADEGSVTMVMEVLQCTEDVARAALRFCFGGTHCVVLCVFFGRIANI